jgi:hypothetical protein
MLSGERIETVSGKRIEAVSGKCQEYRKPRWRQDTIFSGLKQQYGDEILKLVDNAPKRNKGAVFMVVGIKVCVDAEISSQNSYGRCCRHHLCNSDTLGGD